MKAAPPKLRSKFELRNSLCELLVRGKSVHAFSEVEIIIIILLI